VKLLPALYGTQGSLPCPEQVYNSADLHSGDPGFVFRPRHRLSLLKDLVIPSDPPVIVPQFGHDHFSSSDAVIKVEA
jgi:hypothetical protein